MRQKPPILNDPMVGVWYETSEFYPSKNLGKLLAYTPDNENVMWRIVDASIFYACSDSKYWQVPNPPELDQLIL